MTDQTPATRPRARFPIALIMTMASVALIFGAVYGIGGLMRNASGDPDCRPAVDLAAKLKPLVQGEVAALTMATQPLRVPDLTFHDTEGKTRKLSEFRGHPVLVNLWATWCVPCRREMPALDQLQAKLGGSKFDVVAINIDTRDPDKPRDFLKSAGLTKLSYFYDESAKVFQDMKAVGRALGMPTSVLVDGKGCEIGTMAGPAEWHSDDAIQLITAATGQ
jgi:thiol-disulfide isomerase/thioredoxin